MEPSDFSDLVLHHFLRFGGDFWRMCGGGSGLRVSICNSLKTKDVSETVASDHTAQVGQLAAVV